MDSYGYDWVCKRCGLGRESKVVFGYSLSMGRQCAECAAWMTDTDQADYVQMRKGSEMGNTKWKNASSAGHVKVSGGSGGVSDAELRYALAHYSKEDSRATSGMVRAAGTARAVHHTLPCMGQTGCGLSKESISEKVTGYKSFTYDLSKATCEACIAACREAPKDVAKQAADMAWLKEQGEDFASLRWLVEAINDARDAEGFEDTEAIDVLDSDGRAAFVEYIIEQYADTPTDDEREPKMDPGDLGRPYPRTSTAVARDGVWHVTPAGGLCHDDAHKLIDKVRTSVGALRAGRAWPDDALRAAGELESCVESIVGKRVEGERIVGKDPPWCASGCGTILADSATQGSLCTRCMKGAQVHREERRR